MTDLAFFVITGGRAHWYNDAGELIIQSRPGDKCATCCAHLSTGEGHYYPDIKGFLCWLHALQRFIAEVQAKTHPNSPRDTVDTAIKSVPIRGAHWAPLL